jgi:hypothetical protein
MSNNKCVSKCGNCDTVCDYNYESLTKPVNKYPEGTKTVGAGDVHKNLIKNCRKSSSNRTDTKKSMLVFLNQANKVFNASNNCVENTKKSTTGLKKKHNSYERFLAKKRGQVLYNESCKN